MPTHRLPVVIPLSSPWPLRLWDAVQTALSTRRQRRLPASVCELSVQTLEDVGAPDDWRAAAAQCRDRDRMEREMLRVGIVSGAPW